MQSLADSYINGTKVSSMVFYHMQCSRVNKYSMRLMPLSFS